MTTGRINQIATVISAGVPTIDRGRGGSVCRWGAVWSTPRPTGVLYSSGLKSLTLLRGEKPQARAVSVEDVLQPRAVVLVDPSAIP